MCLWLQDEYEVHVHALRQMFAKGQAQACRDLESKLSSKKADIAAEKNSMTVFQQAATLSTNKTTQKHMQQETARATKNVEQLLKEEQTLSLQLVHAAQQHQRAFDQHLLHDLHATSDPSP